MNMGIVLCKGRQGVYHRQESTRMMIPVLHLPASLTIMREKSFILLKENAGKQRRFGNTIQGNAPQRFLFPKEMRKKWPH